MKKFYFSYRKNQGFTLVELMTVLVVIMLLAMVGFPTYQEYQNRAYLAEAESLMGATERSLRTYFLDHGSFYSAAPVPANVPGLTSLGSEGTFTPSGGWLTLGAPIASGSEVNFSYAIFAGGTAPGSTTPIVSDSMNAPIDDMNLIRRVSNSASNQTKTNVAQQEFLLDLNDFYFNASAAEQTLESCIAACRGNQDCVNVCEARYGGDTGDGRGDTDGGGRGGADPSVVAECTAGCMAEDSRRPLSACQGRCELPSDGTCTTSYDIDCYMRDDYGRVPARPNTTCLNVDETGFCPAESGGGSGGGGSGGGEPSGGGETDEGETSGNGGSETDDGETSDTDNSSADGSNAECAAFGVSRPVDFGIQENIPNYQWAVVSGVANLNSGQNCTLVVKVVQAVDGKVKQTEFIKVHE